jgi:hypothetical protein
VERVYDLPLGGRSANDCILVKGLAMTTTWQAKNVTKLASSGIALATVLAIAACAQEPKPAAESPEKPAVVEETPKPGDEPGPDGLVKLSKTHPLWLDMKRKAVVIDGHVVLREGQLEMFACPKGTKEHESVVVLDCVPQDVHAALLALGAKPGQAVKFDPKYVPASGDIVDIYVLWKDEKGEKHQVRAQEWVQHAKTEKALAYDWVFAGSGFWTDEATGQRHYQANGGDFICVSNFPTAMLDLPVESSQTNADLLFNAFTAKIPSKGTKVRVVLVPRVMKKAEDSKVEEAKE